MINKVEKIAQEKGVKITSEGAKIIASCVGNDSLLLYQELEKLAIYQGNKQAPLEVNIIKLLLICICEWVLYVLG